MKEPLRYFLKDDGVFPNSHLPVLHYKKALDLPLFFPARAIKKIFQQHGWTNNWVNGIYTYHHYHSITHEALGISKGKTQLEIGGDNGLKISIAKGDVLIIPAGVAHKNLGSMHAVTCVGGYPNGMDFDMNYGKLEERPKAEHNIASLPVPGTDPVYGIGQGLILLWQAIDK